MPILPLALALLAGASDEVAFERVEQRVFAIAGTDVQAMVPLPGVREVPERLTLLRRSRGDHLLFAADLGTPDVRLIVDGGLAGMLGCLEWRRIGMGDRLAGTAHWDHGHVAYAEAIRPLTQPFRDLDRQAYLVAAGAVLHLHVVALESGDDERFGRARFEAIGDGTRFAIVRRGSWNEFPASYLELSHAACVRADGTSWLAERATAEDSTWVDRFALVEHALSLRDTGVDVATNAEAVRAALAALTAPTREERFAHALSLDALGMGFVGAGDEATGTPHLQAALALAKELESSARFGITADIAMARASVGDAASTAKLLTEAFAGDSTLRERIARNVLFDPVREDARVKSLLTLPGLPGTGKALGR